mgnify:FL=1
MERVDKQVREILALPRDAGKIKREAADMRRLLEEEKPARDIWDLKLISGGLIDLEFIAQVAVLTGNVKGEEATATGAVLASLTDDFCSPQARQELMDAHELYTTLTQITRLCLEGGFDPEEAPPGFADLLLRQTDLPELPVLAAHVEETAAKVRKRFAELIGMLD